MKELDTIPADIALDMGLRRFRQGETGSTAVRTAVEEGLQF